MTTLLCERDVLNKLGWPSRSYLDKRIKTEAFPKPARRSHSIGDQWRLDHIDKWLGIEPRKDDGAEGLKKRFEAMGQAG
jgi:predicted DNA-binding transcriptional regulator AlpA